MKKIISVLTVVVLLAGSLAQSVMAQSIQNDQQREEWIYNKQIGQRAPAPYPPLREADVMWAKKVWRVVDLREKMNQTLYYPTSPQGDLYSLIDVILGEIKSELALNPIIKMLSEHNRWLKGRAIEALGKLGNPIVIPQLTSIFNNNNNQDLKIIIIKAMGLIETTEAITLLQKWSNDPDKDVAANASIILNIRNMK